jgi:hypothetical protein
MEANENRLIRAQNAPRFPAYYRPAAEAVQAYLARHRQTPLDYLFFHAGCRDKLIKCIIS